MGLGSILGAIGGAIAAPFTGGASLIPTLAGIGSGIGGAIDAASQEGGNQAAGAAAGRLAQAQAQNQYDRNALDFYNAGVGRALTIPSIYARQAAAGDNLANLKDVTISGLPPGVSIPTMSGGLRPSNLGANARQAGSQLSRNALLQLMGNKFTLPSMPTQTPLPTPSGYDSSMKWLGNIGGLTGGILSAIPQIPGMSQGGSVLPGADIRDVQGGLYDQLDPNALGGLMQYPG